jgi:hypothetical protein
MRFKGTAPNTSSGSGRAHNGQNSIEPVVLLTIMFLLQHHALDANRHCYHTTSPIGEFIPLLLGFQRLVLPCRLLSTTDFADAMPSFGAHVYAIRYSSELNILATLKRAEETSPRIQIGHFISDNINSMALGRGKWQQGGGKTGAVPIRA